jgi:predicted metal-binding protein
MTVKIGIIICDRYRRCAGGKCLRALKNKEGAFSMYGDTAIELVGMTTCDGCPGGNVEYAGEEMVKNDVSAIHLATGLIVGYPPCPNINTFRSFLEKRYNVKVITGTHPIPQKYFNMHTALETWNNDSLKSAVAPIMTDTTIRAQYD